MLRGLLFVHYSYLFLSADTNPYIEIMSLCALQGLSRSGKLLIDTTHKGKGVEYTSVGLDKQEWRKNIYCWVTNLSEAILFKAHRLSTGMIEWSQEITLSLQSRGAFMHFNHAKEKNLCVLYLIQKLAD